MTREELLSEYIIEKKDTIFRWGENDCCTFASNWVESVTGNNPLKELGHYGEYKNMVEAVKLIKKLGGLPNILDGSLGPSKHPSRAMIGDIVCADMSDGETLGICLGFDSVFLGTKKIETTPTIKSNQCWSI